MKNNLKIFFTLSALILSFAAGVIAVQANTGYWEAGTPPCYDITGSSTPVKVPAVTGVDNSGIMDFDMAASGLDPHYAACVYMSGSVPTTADPQKLKGWVWDDNLGWISLFCGDEGHAFKSNLDVACGTQDYEVDFALTSIVTRPNYGSVKMSGWAWGDNVGWIKFDNTSTDAGVQLSTIPSGGSRGLVDPAAASPQKGNFVWADSVGWFDFSGVKFNWSSTSSVPKIYLCSSKDVGCTCNLAGSCPVPLTSAQIPKADNTENWYVNIIPFDGANIASGSIDFTCANTAYAMTATNPYGTGKAYALCIQFNWVDSVDFNQIQKTSQDGPGGSAAQFNVNNNGAVQNKPFVLTDLTSDYLGTGGYGKTITSYAPTSDRNIYAAEGFANEKFYYMDPNDGVHTNLPNLYNADLVGQNNLTLSALRVMFFKYKTGGAPADCIYGYLDPSGTGTCSTQFYVGGAVGPKLLSFKPLVEVTSLGQNIGSKVLNYLNLTYGTPAQIDYTVVDNGGTNGGFKVFFKTGLENGVGDYIINFVTSALQVIPPLNAFITSPATASYFINLDADPNNPPSSTPADEYPFFSTRIQYNVGVKAISYWGAKLPRIKAGILKNPVAKVAGNIYGTGLSKKALDVDINSLGNVASNFKRGNALENLNKYERGTKADMAHPATGDQTINIETGAGMDQLTALAPNKLFYLKNGNLTIECELFNGGDCKPSSTYTFIVENGSIILKNNIRPTGNNQIGLVAFKDLNSDDTGQGNLYVYSRVVDILNTQVYLDRLMMSCDDLCTHTGFSGDINAGWPTFTDDYDRQAKLLNQLRFAGTISSLNGFGNATGVKKYDEFGAEINPLTTPSHYASIGGASHSDGLARARTADLNFLRYYGPGLQDCLAADALSPGEVIGVPKEQNPVGAVDLANDCNPLAASYLIDPAHLTTDGGDLVLGGSGGLKSAKYATGTSLASEYPVYFDYVPIAKSLLGFEIDKKFNQTETP